MIKRIYTVNWKIVGGFRVEANSDLDAEAIFLSLLDSKNQEGIQAVLESVIDTEVIDVVEEGESW